jgi:CRISPR-associated protein Csb2
LLLEHVAGDMPDIRACALVAKVLRNALLSGYERIGLGSQVPEEISGHAADGTPACRPHVAVAPLAFVGFPYADGHVLGFALIPPHGSRVLEDDDFRRALRLLAPLDIERRRRVLTVRTRNATPSDRAFSIDLSPTFEVDRHSLDPVPYQRRSRTFGTITPIALDRHLKDDGEGRDHEIEVQISAACRNIGLPEPERVIAHKHSAFEGAPSTYPSGRSPQWTQWRLPPSLASRQLVHAIIEFAEAVDGPLLLGAGRFMGLGLCRPLDPERR